MVVVYRSICNTFVWNGRSEVQSSSPSKSDTALPTARHRCDISSQGAVFPRPNDAKTGPAGSLPGLDPFILCLIFKFKFIDFKKTAFKFKFIDFEKTKFKFNNFAKTEFKFKFIDFAEVELKFKFIKNL